MKTLVLNTHPDFGNKDYFSQRLMDLFLEKYHGKFNAEDLEIINLYEDDIPALDKDMLSMWGAQATGSLMTDKQMHIEKRQNELLEQFKSATHVVIVAPTHNFNVTSKMKDYMDNVLIARHTFKYTETGSVGLMTDSRVMLLAASGSIYTNNDRYTPLEFQHYYIEGVFCEIMGFNDFQIVRAQGTAVKPAEEVLAEAAADLETAFASFYK